MSLSRCFSRVAVATVVLAGAARPAAAEIVLLTTGRTLSVRSHTADDDTVTLVLRQGGGLTWPGSLVVPRDQDGRPYPEKTTGPEPSAVARPARALSGPYADVIKS